MGKPGRPQLRGDLDDQAIVAAARVAASRAHELGVASDRPHPAQLGRHTFTEECDDFIGRLGR
jgi:hypothetical protein